MKTSKSNSPEPDPLIVARKSIGNPNTRCQSRRESSGNSRSRLTDRSNSTLAQFFEHAIKKLQHIKVTGHCVYCHQSHSGHSAICEHCLSLIPQFDYHKIEGDLLNRPEIFKLFPKAKFDRLLAITPHQYPLNLWLTQLKYTGSLTYLTHINALITEHLNRLTKVSSSSVVAPDNLVPVPIFIKKWQRRGFNQSYLIAQQLARYFDMTVDNDVIFRVKQNVAQVNQSGAQRRKNLRNNFELNNGIDLRGQSIWLVDDVITTGSTLNEISRLLKAAGVKQITAYALTISL